jgi:phospholipid transport system substrate-binding protein
MNNKILLQRRDMGRLVLAGALLFGAAVAFVRPAYAADEAPDALVKRLSSDVLETIKADSSIKAGDVNKIMLLVDSKIMPNVNFQRMTASAVGPAWRQATPEQQKRLQEEFKTLLVRTYAGALDQVVDQTVTVRPFRGSADDKEVLVRTEIQGRGDPVQLDYRLEKTPGQGAGWKVYNLNVLGVWLVDTYRTQFAQEINKSGIDGLISALAAATRATPRADRPTAIAMLVLPTKLTHDEAPACMRMLQQGLKGQTDSSSTVVDATALAQFDSSALAVLLECRRESSALGRGFSVKGLSPRLRELAALYGIAGLLPAAP